MLSDSLPKLYAAAIQLRLQHTRKVAQEPVNRPSNLPDDAKTPECPDIPDLYPPGFHPHLPQSGDFA